MNGVTRGWLKQVGTRIHTAFCPGQEQNTLRTGGVHLHPKKCGLIAANFQCNQKK